MPILSYRIAPGPCRAITPPICFGAALRQASYAARRVAPRERVNLPHRRAAIATSNPKSTFSRIIPMNPEPTATLAQNPKSTFSRIIPVNPELTAASAQIPKSAFSRISPPAGEPAAALTSTPESMISRINPLVPEPAAASAENPKSTFPRINPLASQPPAARFMTGMIPGAEKVDVRELDAAPLSLREAKRRSNLPPGECIGFAVRGLASSLRFSQ